MRATVIQAQGLSKRYRLGVTGRQTVASEFNAFVARTRGKADPRNAGAEGGDQRKGDQFWALRNVSFDVAQGEVLGLIGRNGAGKSTVLKLLSRITLPTSGSIHMKGRVSSLLEVGTGFHPELTGMENIYLNGAIMGMRRAEIDTKLDEIIAFSGIEHHIDTPIKRYSSGMKVRLGFAVAAHLEPDILVVDEVLAVGDAEFQKRCLGQMRSVADSGRTIIFVSHNMFSVQSLCTRAIWLDKGTVRTDGEVVSVVRDYLAECAAQTDHQQWTEADAPGTDEVRLMALRATSADAEGSFTTEAAITIELDLRNLTITDTDLNIQLHVHTDTDALAFVSDMTERIGTALWPLGANTVRCTIPAQLLNDGEYRISVLFQRKGNRHFLVQDALSIVVQEGPRQGAWFQKWQGTLRPALHWVR
ncbi:MAG: ATP-binding cassette domain-containing protein [Flavobacteriales bacterium]|nr:ATP-binding cassette domain-containing protein [Flavobacteriales bacterium]